MTIRHYLSNCDLSQLRDELPHVEDLSIALVVRENDRLPYDALEILVGLPSLRHLTVWIEHGDNVTSRYTRKMPEVNDTSARHLLQYLRACSSTLQFLTANISGYLPGEVFTCETMPWWERNTRDELGDIKIERRPLFLVYRFSPLVDRGGGCQTRD